MAVTPCQLRRRPHFRPSTTACHSGRAKLLRGQPWAFYFSARSLPVPGPSSSRSFGLVHRASRPCHPASALLPTPKAFLFGDRLIYSCLGLLACLPPLFRSLQHGTLEQDGTSDPRRERVALLRSHQRVQLCRRPHREPSRRWLPALQSGMGTWSSGRPGHYSHDHIQAKDACGDQGASSNTRYAVVVAHQEVQPANSKQVYLILARLGVYLFRERSLLGILPTCSEYAFSAIPWMSAKRLLARNTDPYMLGR